MTRSKLVLLAVTLSGLLAREATADIVVMDPVEPNDGWLFTGGHPTKFTDSGVAGINARAGAFVLHLQNAGGQDATKQFAGTTLQTGTYTATFDIGNYNNRPFAVLDLSRTGLTAGGTVLTASTSVTPTPADGADETWTLIYDVLANDANLGTTLGFRIFAPDLGLDQNVSFDNLSIAQQVAAVPEPSSLTLAGLVFGAGILLRRRRNRAA